MKRKWEPKVIENVRVEEINRREYEQLIEEVAGIIYADICQLQKIQFLDAEFPERGPLNFLNGYHLISSKGTTQFPIMGTIF